MHVFCNKLQICRCLWILLTAGFPIPALQKLVLFLGIISVQCPFQELCWLKLFQMSILPVFFVVFSWLPIFGSHSPIAMGSCGLWYSVHISAYLIVQLSGCIPQTCTLRMCYVRPKSPVLSMYFWHGMTVKQDILNEQTASDVFLHHTYSQK